MNRSQRTFKSMLAALSAALLLACAGNTARTGAPAKTTPITGKSGQALRRQDILWLGRVDFGLDSAAVAAYNQMGRTQYLQKQLDDRSAALPPAIEAQIAALDLSHTDALHLLAEVNAQNKIINAMADGPDKEQSRKALNDRGYKLAYEASRRELLRAVYSPSQLQEQMVWFWLNHFSVHRDKANLRWLIGDYAEHAIRPHALGHFKDLVLATLEHPAMLQYLDNNQNANGHLNENYAREVMELHTLGVTGGYSQTDVQQLARVLTGVGVNAGDPPKLKPEWQRLYRRNGAFEFNPARHDFGPKTLLGHTVVSTGFDETEEAIALIVHRPACARFISRELAIYFVADNPPASLVERMSQTFMQTDGDIAAVLKTMFLSRELDAALGGKFKDPERFVISSVRFAYDGRPIDNTRPLLNWLNSLGEAPFGRPTPDGYPLTESSWASSGQMSRRFEIAHAIGAGNAGLFDPEDGGTATTTGFPQLSNRLYYAAIEPFLAVRTRDALEHASSQQEWNTFLLSSPDFSYE